jgi:uncharacterized lipoprotein YmbA
MRYLLATLMLLLAGCSNKTTTAKYREFLYDANGKPVTYVTGDRSKVLRAKAIVQRLQTTRLETPEGAAFISSLENELRNDKELRQHVRVFIALGEQQREDACGY